MINQLLQSYQTKAQPVQPKFSEILKQRAIANKAKNEAYQGLVAQKKF